jgi:hypothetical protein
MLMLDRRMPVLQVNASHSRHICIQAHCSRQRDFRFTSRKRCSVILVALGGRHEPDLGK